MEWEANDSSMKGILFGCAYYDEYMVYERLEKDMQMMKEAGMNTIRIAESTWSCHEPQDGVFDFSHVERVIEAADKAGISVIVGTPTYAIPPWLAAKHPEILADTGHGREKYGRRQNMDITSPAYLYHAERIIRKLMEASAKAPNVIGVQLDNETKHYGTCSANVQKMFLAHLKSEFGDVSRLNKAFGFNYWSNSVSSWEDVPDVTGSINASFVAEFNKFRRNLVTEFLSWQSQIVKGYLRDDQFVTHNFDYHWKGNSYGIQPDVNHKHAQKALTLVGCDIYHPSQDLLTGAEAAVCGAAAYGLKKRNYLVLETQAQGLTNWTPYPGQLRLQALSHLASGASGIMYWHWHSIHHSNETFWKGVLSHDLEPNETYWEASQIGKELESLSQLKDLKKASQVAILASNESLEGIERFPFPGGKLDYNDVFRWMHDSLYEMNIEADVIFPEDCEDLDKYKMILVPALCCAPDSLLDALGAYTSNGGFLVSSFKSGFFNEYMEARHEIMPLPHVFGMAYDAFTEPREVPLISPLLPEGAKASVWMEMLRPESAEVLAWHNRQVCGSGFAACIGCCMGKDCLKPLLESILRDAGLWGEAQSGHA
ncbi:MAG: beta-galactosidase, partial [Clostridiales bacterium]|nr:beta-galactosidase [Clostridiales bacterium]